MNPVSPYPAVGGGDSRQGPSLRDANTKEMGR